MKMFRKLKFSNKFKLIQDYLFYYNFIIKN
jgi:hypothetical protein